MLSPCGANELTPLPPSSSHACAPPPPPLAAVAPSRDVSDNSLDGPLPPEIGKLTRLTHLNAHGNRFANSIPDELSALTNLIVLTLEYNQFTGAETGICSIFATLTDCSLTPNLQWTDGAATPACLMGTACTPPVARIANLATVTAVATEGKLALDAPLTSLDVGEPKETKAFLSALDDRVNSINCKTNWEGVNWCADAIDAAARISSRRLHRTTLIPSLTPPISLSLSFTPRSTPQRNGHIGEYTYARDQSRDASLHSTRSKRI